VGGQRRDGTSVETGPASRRDQRRDGTSVETGPASRRDQRRDGTSVRQRRDGTSVRQRRDGTSVRQRRDGRGPASRRTRTSVETDADQRRDGRGRTSVRSRGSGRTSRRCGRPSRFRLDKLPRPPASRRNRGTFTSGQRDAVPSVPSRWSLPVRPFPLVPSRWSIPVGPFPLVPSRWSRVPCRDGRGPASRRTRSRVETLRTSVPLPRLRCGRRDAEARTRSRWSLPVGPVPSRACNDASGPRARRDGRGTREGTRDRRDGRGTVETREGTRDRRDAGRDAGPSRRTRTAVPRPLSVSTSGTGPRPASRRCGRPSRFRLDKLPRLRCVADVETRKRGQRPRERKSCPIRPSVRPSVRPSGPFPRL
jgi:hypothetical protein